MGTAKLVQMLLAAKANPNAQETIGDTPLLLAVRAQPRQRRVDGKAGGALACSVRQFASL